MMEQWVNIFKDMILLAQNNPIGFCLVSGVAFVVSIFAFKQKSLHSSVKELIKRRKK